MLRPKQIVADPVALALRVLTWTLTEPTRADRLLALTGLSGEELRQRAMEPAVLAAALNFLEAHEPDLIACAEALRISPTDLVHVREMLEA